MDELRQLLAFIAQGLPPWQTDPRSSYNEPRGPNLVMKRAYEAALESGQPYKTLTLWIFKGGVGGNDVVTVFGNYQQDVINVMVEEAKRWSGDPVEAVFITSADSPGEALVVWDSFHGYTRLPISHESFNLNPYNDKHFVKRLKDLIGTGWPEDFGQPLFGQNIRKQLHRIVGLDPMLDAYLYTALSTTETEDGEPFIKLLNRGEAEWSGEAILEARDDCQKFQEKCGDLIKSDLPGAGTDFWLTRNGHGAGFWDGDWGDDGEVLTECAKSFGLSDVYVGDDNQFYFFPGKSTQPSWLGQPLF